MPVREFDRDFADEIIRRLKALPSDRKPNWGQMAASDLVPHLAQWTLYSMGRRGTLPVTGGWVTQKVIGPLVVNGWIPILKNAPTGPAVAPDCAAYTIEDLQAILDDYLSAVETGALQTEPHPFFGDLGVDGWAKMHSLHYQHHFKQFDL